MLIQTYEGKTILEWSLFAKGLQQTIEAQAQRIVQLEARVKELEQEIERVKAVRIDWRHTLTPKELSDPEYMQAYVEEMGTVVDGEIQRVKALEAENARLKGRIAVDEDSHL